MSAKPTILPNVLLGLTPDELAERLESAERARVVFSALARGEDPFSSESVYSGVRRRLADAARSTPYDVVAEQTAVDGTKKTLVRLSSNEREVEFVVIPTPRRSTLCVSSQVGCKRACEFCLTGTMGLVSDLRADEIVLQLWLAKRAGHAIRNVVFMGMGEPLDNLAAVRRAVEVMTDPRGFEIAPRHLTVSTVGPSPGAIDELADLPTRVAWSLHTADDDIRADLIRTHRHPVRDLRDAFGRVCATKKMPLFVEVTLIDGKNDRDADARTIADLFEGFPTEVRINLLPMNPIGNTLEPSPRITEFASALRARGLFTMVRRARGDEERSACGQLHANVSRRLKVV